MSYKNGYLSAYDWNGFNKGALEEAVRMAFREDIQKRIAELQKPIVEAISKDAISEKSPSVLFQLGKTDGLFLLRLWRKISAIRVTAF